MRACAWGSIQDWSGSIVQISPSEHESTEVRRMKGNPVLLHRQAQVALNHLMATLSVLMTVPCIPCKTSRKQCSRLCKVTLTMYRYRQERKDIYREARNQIHLFDQQNCIHLLGHHPICASPWVPFWLWLLSDRNKVPRDCKKRQSSIPHKLSGSTGITAADTWLGSSSLCQHHVSLSTRFSKLLHCPAQQPRSDDRTTAVQADNRPTAVQANNSVLCSPGWLHLECSHVQAGSTGHLP